MGIELALCDYFRRRLFARIFDDPADVIGGVLSKAEILFLNGEINLFPLLGITAGYALGCWLIFWHGSVLLSRLHAIGSLVALRLA